MYFARSSRLLHSALCCKLCLYNCTKIMHARYFRGIFWVSSHQIGYGMRGVFEYPILNILTHIKKCTFDFIKDV